MTTAGEKDDEDAGDNPEHDELPQEKTLRPDEVFQKISFRPNMEEQKKLLLFQFQARHNQYVKDFLAQSWMKEDPFADACKLQNSTRHSLHDVFAELQSWNAVASSETRTIFWDYKFVLVSFKKGDGVEGVCFEKVGFEKGCLHLRTHVRTFWDRVDMVWCKTTKTESSLPVKKLRMHLSRKLCHGYLPSVFASVLRMSTRNLPIL